MGRGDKVFLGGRGKGACVYSSVLGLLGSTSQPVLSVLVCIAIGVPSLMVSVCFSLRN